MAAKVTSIHKEKTNNCPICRKNSISPHTPFCSRRCSQLDLGNWLKEAYFIPTHDFQHEPYEEKLSIEIDEDS